MDGSCASKRNELKFIVDTATLTDAVVDGLGETEDVLCGGTGYGDSFVIITEEGESAHDAIRRACVKLQVNGLIVRDLQRDLVTASQIAQRTGLTRQAVHHWMRGTRRGGAFPSPFDPTNGLWLWGEVQRWAMDTGMPVDDAGVRYPSRADHDRAGMSIDCGWKAAVPRYSTP